MSDVSGLEPTSFARLDALARRGRSGDSAGPGAGFDTLLAQARARMMSNLASGKQPTYGTKPRGALGMSTPPNTTAALALPSRSGADGSDDLPAGPVGDGSFDLVADGLSAAAPTAASAVRATELTPASVVDESITRASVSAAGRLVVHAALDQVAAPYAAGGTDPDTGFDAAGLVRYAYRAVGVEMPTNAAAQATMGIAIESLDHALPGDVLSFGRPVDHVALYAGDQNVVHLPGADEPVRVEAIERPVESIRRVVTPGADSVSEITVPAGDREQQYLPMFESAGRQWDVSPALLAAIAETESNFNPTAVSPVGAQGLMQFMPATAREMNVDPWDPASAIDGAARYMRTSLDQFQEPELAIASYNAGRGAVSRYGGIPPFTETQNYVRKVLDGWRSRS